MYFGFAPTSRICIFFDVLCFDMTGVKYILGKLQGCPFHAFGASADKAIILLPYEKKNQEKGL